LFQIFKAHSAQSLPSLAGSRRKSATLRRDVLIFFILLIAAGGASAYFGRYTGPESFMKVTKEMTASDMEAVIGRPADKVVSYQAATGTNWTGYNWRSKDGHFVLSADFPTGGDADIILEEDGGTPHHHSWRDSGLMR
jgi:hypothetical protein